MIKKTFFLIALFLGLAISVSAQVSMAQLNSIGKSLSPGSAFTELGKGIKPEAFKPEWAQISKNWFKKAANLGINDYKGGSKLLSDLSKNLKPTAFNNTIKDPAQFIKNLGNIKSMSTLGNSMAKLTKGLNTNILTDSFKKKMGPFLEGLKLIR